MAIIVPSSLLFIDHRTNVKKCTKTVHIREQVFLLHLILRLINIDIFQTLYNNVTAQRGNKLNDVFVV